MDDDRYVLLAPSDRNWLDAVIRDELSIGPDTEWVSDGTGCLDVIAAGSFDACRAAGRLLLEES